MVVRCVNRISRGDTQQRTGLSSAQWCFPTPCSPPWSARTVEALRSAAIAAVEAPGILEAVSSAQVVLASICRGGRGH